MLEVWFMPLCDSHSGFEKQRKGGCILREVRRDSPVTVDADADRWSHVRPTPARGELRCLEAIASIF